MLILLVACIFLGDIANPEGAQEYTLLQEYYHCGTPAAYTWRACTCQTGEM